MGHRFNYEILAKRFKELAFLNPGIGIRLHDETKSKTQYLKYDGGLVEFVQYLHPNKIPTHSKIFYAKGIKVVSHPKRLPVTVDVEVAIQWKEGYPQEYDGPREEDYKEKVLCFTNTIPQDEGGKHLEGFRAALTLTLQKYLKREGFYEKFKVEPVADDIREGLVAVLSIKLADPIFSSQTKDKLTSLEAREGVQSVLSEKLEAFLLENPNDAKAIAMKVIKAAQVRKRLIQVREATRKGPLMSIASLPGKLSDCQETNPAQCELFIVEGNSAGGTTKQGRNRRYQAVLPLRGKILNVERAGFDKMLSSEEVGSLITALGCGIGPKGYHLDKLRYHRIIIMTDADVDGSHIRTLLLTFFYRHMRELIQQGYVYIAQPPLYRLKKGKQEHYLKDDAALEAKLAQAALENVQFYKTSVQATEQPDLTGETLSPLFAQYRAVRMLLKFWEKRYPPVCLQALLEIHPINLEDLNSHERMNVFCQQWQSVTDIHTQDDLSSHYQFTCEPHVEHDGEVEQTFYLPKIQEKRYGNESDYTIPKSFFENMDYSKIKTLASQIQGLVQPDALVKRDSRQQKVVNFYQLYEWLLEEAKKSYNIQRYKGLGEMNADQLELVLKPEVRRLSQVDIKDAQLADEMFTILMGQVVEPRRIFIEQNALDVDNIDV